MRIVTVLSVAGALLAFANSLTGIRWLHGLLASRSPALPDDAVADVAIVLGYALFRNGSLTEPLKGRVQAGVDMFVKGRARHLLFSGSHPGGAVVQRTEANVMREYAEQQLLLLRGDDDDGTAAAEALDRWVEEDASTSTYENALYSLAICRQKGWRSILVVTSPFHQLRSELVFRRLASATDAPTRGAGQQDGTFKVYMARTAFVPHVGYPLGPSGNRLVDLWDLARELLALGYYAVRGRL